MTGPEAHGDINGQWPTGPHANHQVELVGPHLWVRGQLAPGRFPSLSDLINHNRGFIVLLGAALLDRQGDVIGPMLPELVVNQDEITFVGHEAGDADGAARPAGAGFVRHFLVFTPGHTVSGAIHFHREMTLASFVEATDPRFLSMTDATTRSLSNQRVVGRYGLLLVNRTQINAIAETERDLVLDIHGGQERPAGENT